jgi:hypothetical protein
MQISSISLGPVAMNKHRRIRENGTGRVRNHTLQLPAGRCIRSMSIDSQGKGKAEPDSLRLSYGPPCFRQDIRYFLMEADN